MPYHIDEENSELVFEVREGNKLVIKLKSNTGGGGSDIYLIKTGDETTPTEKNTFSSLRILKEIEQLHETILQEVGSYLSVWEIKQAENGEKYISTKYDVVTEKGITAYASGIKDAGSIVDGIPFDNKTIWFNPETGVVEVIGGTGGGSFDSSKMWELLLSDTDEQINISHLSDALSGYATEEELRKKWTQDDNKISNWDTAFSWGDHSKSGYAHLANEETFSDIKHFTQGLTVGEGKHKLYEKDGVVYLDGDLAVTGGLTAYALGDTDISTIMDGVVVDGTTIKKENGQLVAIVGSGSSFDKSAMWAALSDDTTEQINKSHLTTALSGYATTTQLNTKWTQDNTKISNWDDAYSWGNHASAGYAKQTSLDAVSSKLDDFLEGSDTDSIINKWKELESFLSGMTESDNLADILSTKADKSFVTSELTKYVTLTTSQTISGAKTFTSLLTTAAIKAKGDINTPNVRTSDSVYINGIRLYKSPEGNLILDGNLLVTGGVTAYSTGEEGGGSSGGLDVDLMWEILGGTGTQQINKTHLTDALNGYATQSWVTSQNYLKSVSIATISDLNSSWDALLKAAPSAYVTRWPSISEVTSKQNLIVKLNGGTTEGTNQFTYNATAAKTINITPSGIGAALSSHNHSWANITSGKPTTLSGYGITDAYTKTESDSRFVNVSGDTITGDLKILNLEISHNNEINSSDKVCIAFRNTPDGLNVCYNNSPFTYGKNGYKVWHAGNDGSGSGLDADLLDGLDSTKFFRYIASYSRGGGLSSQYVKVVPKSTYQRSSFYITRYRDGLVGTFIFSPDLYENTSRVLTQIGGNKNQYWVWYYDSSNKCYYLELNGNSNFAIIGYENNITTSVVDSPSGVSNHSKMLANIEDNVASATKLQTARQINGTNFDGTANITTAKWGTARTITLGSYLSGSVSLDGSANVTLNANVNGLTSQGRKTAISGTTVPSSGVRLYEVYNNGYPKAYGNLLSISGAGSTELLLAWKSTQRIYVRSKSDILTEEWSAWKTVAFTDDNVESATKLQTPRTLWGRSFDGTANISGNLDNVGNLNAASDNSYLARNASNQIDGIPWYGLGIMRNENFFNNKGSAFVSGYFGVLLRAGGEVNLKLDYDSRSIIASTKIIAPSVESKANSWLDLKGERGIGIYTAGVSRVGISAEGKVNIGTGAPQYMLHVYGSTGTEELYVNGIRLHKTQDGVLKLEGSLLATGGVTLYTSDSRSKKIVEELSLPLKYIAESPTIRFKWNGWNIPDDDKTHIGGIAQYVQKILPECILDADGVLNMDYSTTAYIYSVQTARHLQTYETRTDRKIKKLEKRVRFLEKQLKKLGYEEVNTLVN